MSIAHATKRIFSRASTTKKSIDKGLNQEFVDSRRRLNDISQSVKSLYKSIHSCRQVWTAVAKHNREFTKTLASSFPESGNVQQHANEVEQLLRNIQELLINEDTKESSHQKIVIVLDKYIELIQSIEQQYKSIETAYTEKSRYERKVDKLDNKKESKKPQKLVRNIEKMNSAQKALDEKVNSILIRMRSAFDKHQAVLQCAHHAYWMANNSYLTTIENSTRNIRVESIAVHNRLLSIEVQEDKILTPIPRVNLIEELDGNTNKPITVVIDSGNSTTTSAHDKTDTDTDTSTTVQQMPTVTSKNGTNLNIPEPPTALPKAPIPTITTTTAEITTTNPTPSPISA